ncbi:hypothetical protein [Actinomyces haliotis]|uniref:hypothetical protein n=1 Tax=Actinomyces haliotis TaxID=1280843 RepID=UPI0018907FCF|nr:hypothetical protein [Actinomyces haliotis]
MVVAIGMLAGCSAGSPSSASTDLSWQLGALEANWNLTVPDGVRLVAYYSSDPGPHGEHDAVYVLADDSRDGAWVSGAFGALGEAGSKLLDRIESSAAASGVAPDSADILCKPAISQNQDDRLVLCKESADSGREFVFESIQ